MGIGAGQSAALSRLCYNKYTNRSPHCYIPSVGAAASCRTQGLAAGKCNTRYQVTVQCFPPKSGIASLSLGCLRGMMCASPHLLFADEVQLQGDELLQLRQHRSQEGLTVDGVTAAHIDSWTLTVLQHHVIRCAAGTHARWQLDAFCAAEPYIVVCGHLDGQCGVICLLSNTKQWRMRAYGCARCDTGSTDLHC